MKRRLCGSALKASTECCAFHSKKARSGSNKIFMSLLLSSFSPAPAVVKVDVRVTGRITKVEKAPKTTRATTTKRGMCRPVFACDSSLEAESFIIIIVMCKMDCQCSSKGTVGMEGRESSSGVIETSIVCCCRRLPNKQAKGAKDDYYWVENSQNVTNVTKRTLGLHS